MDILSHITQGFLIGYVPTGSIAVGVVTGVMAGVPDIGGEIMARLGKDGYKWYDSTHKGRINKFMRWFPPWGLHTWLDSFSHGAGKRWWVWKERLWLELLIWIINIYLIILILKIKTV